jgi:hypothetical protein
MSERAAHPEQNEHAAGRAELARRRQEARLDEALQETFPASDRISPALAAEPLQRKS